MKTEIILSAVLLVFTQAQPAFAHTGCPPAGGFSCVVEEPIWIDPFEFDNPRYPGQVDGIYRNACYHLCEALALEAYYECMASPDPTMCEAVRDNLRIECRAECDRVSH